MAYAFKDSSISPHLAILVADHLVAAISHQARQWIEQTYPHELNGLVSVALEDYVTKRRQLAASIEADNAPAL